MKLIEYFQACGRSLSKESADLADIAAQAGVATSTLYMVTLGHKKIGPQAARRIEVATGGEVSRHDLRPDIFGPAPSIPSNLATCADAQQVA